MPLITDPDAFIEGGRRGIKVFEAVYTGFEDDLPNQFDEKRLRSRFRFSDVEILESEAPVELNNNEFDFYINQSNQKRSTNQFLVDDWQEAAEAIGVSGPALAALQGHRLRFEKVEYDFGGDFNNAVVYVPTAKAGDAPAVDKSTTAPSTGEDVSGEDPLYDFVVEAAGDGATAATLSSALSKAPAAIRKAALAQGGGQKYIAALVSEGLLSEEEGVISAPAF